MNQYRHSKSSLFLMEIILNILFFSILATFCVQIFFKGYQLSKSTEKLHQAVTACTSIAEICQSTDSPKETLSSIYPESMSLNETILIYYNKDFLACGKQNAVYRATVDFLPDQLANIHLTFFQTVQHILMPIVSDIFYVWSVFTRKCPDKSRHYIGN